MWWNRREMRLMSKTKDKRLFGPGVSIGRCFLGASIKQEEGIRNVMGI
jgi:hypothetical protein